MSEILSVACPRCYLCGNAGLLIHRRLEDKLFDAPGAWNLRQCPDQKCGLLWMDPMPLPEELPKAYAGYYTHDNAGENEQAGSLKRLYREVKLAHLSSALGYKSVSVGGMARRISKLLFFFPQRSTGIEEEIMFLPAQPGGKLLDVGCGSGQRLEQMQRLGWTVSGLDFDEKAVAAAKQRGLDVSCGTIPGIWFPPDTFDVITMNHVIEHVPNPIELLEECKRILKPGGKVVLATPNSACWGHRVFKKNWRGLEPPRHLHVFSPISIEQTLRNAGFEKVEVRTFDSAYVWRLSLMLRFNLTKHSANDFRVKIAKWLAAILSSAEHIGLQFNSSAGECLSAVAVKESVANS
jgi:2-polyprenyl-3-methyl-5-hydroxy-6-metoxy-1,4-benzoquinol methylase